MTLKVEAYGDNAADLHDSIWRARNRYSEFTYLGIETIHGKWVRAIFDDGAFDAATEGGNTKHYPITTHVGCPR